MGILQKSILAGLSILLVIMILTCVIVTMQKNAEGQSDGFVVPPFDASASYGVPTDIPKELAYGNMKIREDFKISMCTKPVVNGKDVDVYFTAGENNGVYVRLLLLNEAGEIIGESGVLKPGEYVKTILLKSALTESAAVTAKILSYEPETYYSMGTVTAQIYLTVKK